MKTFNEPNGRASDTSQKVNQMKMQNWSEHKAAENILKYSLTYIDIFTQIY